MRKTVFFDRDGVLNVERNYLYKIEEFQWQTDAVAAIKLLQAQDYRIIVVTNQSGVARGYYNEADVSKLHNYMQAQLALQQTRIDAFYYCPHLPDASRSACVFFHNAPYLPLQIASGCQALDIPPA